LAIDRSQQGRGLGRALFRDCALRVVHAADTIGIRGIAVQAISDQAKAFYQALGFDPSPADPMILMVTLADIRKFLAHVGMSVSFAKKLRAQVPPADSEQGVHVTEEKPVCELLIGHLSEFVLDLLTQHLSRSPRTG
jgi:hypothetical protein